MTATKNRRFIIGLHIIAVFFYWMSMYLFVPTLPVYVRSRTDNLSMVGVVLAMYGLWQAIIRLPLGIIADWAGRRKPFIIMCFAFGALGCWIMGSSEGVSGLLIGRSLTGLAAGSWVLLIVSFNSLFTQQEIVKATAMITLVGSVSRMLATGVTGYLNNWQGYFFAFYLSAAAAVLAILLIIPIREVRRAPKRPSLQSLVTLITRKDVLLPSILGLIVQYAGWTTTFGFFPLLAKELGASGVTLSMLVSMNVAVVVFGNLTATTLVSKIGARRLAALSFLVQAAGIGLAAFAPSLALVFAAQFLVGCAFGVSYPLLMGMSIQFVAENERATAMGLHQAVYAIGMFSGPWLSGILADRIGMRPMFAVTSVACAVLGVLGTRWLSDFRD